MKQIKMPISFGVGATGRKRLRLYRERLKAKGYKNLSDYILALLDKEVAAEEQPRSLPRNAITHRKTAVSA